MIFGICSGAAEKQLASEAGERRSVCVCVCDHDLSGLLKDKQKSEVTGS